MNPLPDQSQPYEPLKAHHFPACADCIFAGLGHEANLWCLSLCGGTAPVSPQDMVVIELHRNIGEQDRAPQECDPSGLPSQGNASVLGQADRPPQSVGQSDDL